MAKYGGYNKLGRGGVEKGSVGPSKTTRAQSGPKAPGSSHSFGQVHRTNEYRDDVTSGMKQMNPYPGRTGGNYSGPGSR